MNQSDLIHAIANDTGLPKKAVGDVLASLGHMATGELARAHGEVPLPGLGKLKAVTRAGRTGRDPRSGAAVEIPERRAAKFVPAKALKEALQLA